MTGYTDFVSSLGKGCKLHISSYVSIYTDMPSLIIDPHKLRQVLRIDRIPGGPMTWTPYLKTRLLKLDVLN